MRDYPGDVVTENSVISCKMTKQAPPKDVRDAIKYAGVWDRPYWILIERYDCEGVPVDVVTISLAHFLASFGYNPPTSRPEHLEVNGDGRTDT